MSGLHPEGDAVTQRASTSGLERRGAREGANDQVGAGGQTRVACIRVAGMGTEAGVRKAFPAPLARRLIQSPWPLLPPLLGAHHRVFQSFRGMEATRRQEPCPSPVPHTISGTFSTQNIGVIKSVNTNVSLWLRACPFNSDHSWGDADASN